MMRKNNMIASLIFLSSLCILLCITRAADDFLIGLVPDTKEESAFPATPDPRSCKNLKGRDPKEPLLNVPSYGRPDYARSDPCWNPRDDRKCTIANYFSNPGQGFEYTFTCAKCTFHMRSGASGNTSDYSCK